MKTSGNTHVESTHLVSVWTQRHFGANEQTKHVQCHYYTIANGRAEIMRVVSTVETNTFLTNGPITRELFHGPGTIYKVCSKKRCSFTQFTASSTEEELHSAATMRTLLLTAALLAGLMCSSAAVPSPPYHAFCRTLW